jgi:HTH-type transcriptional regulator, bacterioopsin transcriptional activator and related proteins
MTSSTLSPARVLEVVDTLGPPNTPVTTPEVAAEFDCTDRTIYNKLETLVEDGPLETKKVGARGRVWWRPVDNETEETGNSNRAREQVRSHPVFDSEMVGVIVWGGDFTIRDANAAFLEMAGMEYEEALGTSWRDLTPEEFYLDSKRHIEQVEETGSGVPYEKQYYHSDGTRWWGLFESQTLNDSEKVEFVIDITDRKEAKKGLEREAELAAFRVELIDVIRPLTDPVEVQQEAARVLGEWLDVDRAHYTEVGDDGDTFWIHSDYYRGDIPSVTGEHHLSNYGEYIVDTLRTGKNLVLTDTQSAPELSDEDRAAYAAVDNHANVAVPLVKDGCLVAFFSVDNAEPREWIETEVAMVKETAERTWAAVERASVEQALRESEVALERLNDASRELIDTNMETIADRVASLVLAILDVEYAALWRYDDQSGDLEEHAADAAGDGDVDAFRVPSEVSDWVWQTFIGTGIHVENDIDGQIGESLPLRSCAFVPLGRHGVVLFGSTQADTFDERTVELAETTAATVETAWDRAQGEHQLSERNEELERLDRLNALIRGVHQHLVDADSRETIEQAVVEQLADSALYEFAWIGTRDPGTDTVTPREWAGVDDGYLDMLAISTERTGLDENPIAAAIRTTDLQVVADVAIDPRTAPWREATLDRGARSCIAIPLRYNRSGYGVLAVYTSSPQSDERDHAVLKELGETIAHAIDAVETKRTLLSDSVTELTLEIHDGDDVLTALARASDCEITFDSLVPQRDGAARLFFATEDVSAKEVLDEARRLPSIAEVTLLREAEAESVFEATVTESTLASHVIENGGLVRSLTVTADMTTAIIDQPIDTTVREFVETIRIEYPSTDLVARHSRDRPIRTREDMRAALSERLTARQREILETAYRSGYFESPRVQTGRDLSEALDITQSTFSHHLREGERRLCELVFDSA